MKKANASTLKKAMAPSSPTSVSVATGELLYPEDSWVLENQYKGMTALIMGKLYRRNGEWKFSAIGDAYPDANLCETIKRIVTNYTK